LNVVVLDLERIFFLGDLGEVGKEKVVLFKQSIVLSFVDLKLLFGLQFVGFVDSWNLGLGSSNNGDRV
jgi:hypothetical protein